MNEVRVSLALSFPGGYTSECDVPFIAGSSGQAEYTGKWMGSNLSSLGPNLDSATYLKKVI